MDIEYKQNEIPYLYRITVENLDEKDSKPDIYEVSSAMIFLTNGQLLKDIEMKSFMIGTQKLLMYLCLSLPNMVGHFIKKLQESDRMQKNAKKAD